MMLIGRAATSQPQLPILELREQEMMNMYYSKPKRSYSLTASLVRKSDSFQSLRKDIGQVDESSSLQQSQLENVN